MDVSISSVGPKLTERKGSEMSKLRNHFNTFSNLVNTKHKICNLSVYSGVLNMSKLSEQRRVRLPATQTTAESREQLTEAGWKSN